MKVALVGSHPVPAVGQHLESPAGDMASLASALAMRGLDVTVYSCGVGDSESQVTKPNAGYRVKYLPSRFPGRPDHTASDAELAAVMGEFARFLDVELGSDRPDVVNASSWLYGVPAQLAADHHGIPSVQSLPALSCVVRRRQQRLIGPSTRVRFEQLLARSATRVTVSCTEDVLDVIRLGCSRSRVSVLPQAVDAEMFSAVGPAEAREREHRIVALARDLLPFKGLDDLIRALPRLPAAELVVVGGPLGDRLDRDPGASELRRLAIDLGVASRVRMVGPVSPERLSRILRSADVFACPSWYEPFGLPAVEAMSCGLPVVASEAGGMLDTVIHGVTGMLVPARDSRALARALGEVLNGGSLRLGMGLAGRTRAQSRYSWERVAAELHTICQRAAELPAMRPADMSRRIATSAAR